MNDNGKRDSIRHNPIDISEEKIDRPQDEKLTEKDIETVSGGVTGFRPRFRRYKIVNGEMVNDPNDDGHT